MMFRFMSHIFKIITPRVGGRGRKQHWISDKILKDQKGHCYTALFITSTPLYLVDLV